MEPYYLVLAIYLVISIASYLSCSSYVIYSLICARSPKDRGSPFRGSPVIFWKSTLRFSCIVVNTKKGEIERTFVFPSCFDVDDNTIKCTNVKTQLCRFSKKCRRKKKFLEGFLCSPEVPVVLPVLPLELPVGTTGGTSAPPLEFPGSCTGSSTGTSGKPEVPVHSAVLPVITSGAHFRSKYRYAPVNLRKLHRKCDRNFR